MLYKNKTPFIFFLACILILLMGCSLPFTITAVENTPESPAEIPATAVETTATSTPSLTPVQSTSTALPTEVPATAAPTEVPPTAIPTQVQPTEIVLPSPTALPPTAVILPTATRAPVATDYDCSLYRQSPEWHAKMRPNQDFDTNWSIVNNASSTWDMEDISLRFIRGAELAENDNYIYLPEDLSPKESTNIVIDMIAPNSTGEFTAVYGVFNDDDDLLCAEAVSIIVE